MNNKIPFGYKTVGKTIVRNERQATVVWDIFSLFIGGDGPEEIARKFNKFHILNTTDSSVWDVDTICTILGNQAYVEPPPRTYSIYPGIIERGMFERAQKRLQLLELV